MVNRDIEITLYLKRMDVEHEYAICPCNCNQIRNQLRCNGCSGLGFPVLTPISVIGDHRSDSTGGCPLESIKDNEQFHDILTCRIGG